MRRIRLTYRRHIIRITSTLAHIGNHGFNGDFVRRNNVDYPFFDLLRKPVCRVDISTGRILDKNIYVFGFILREVKRFRRKYRHESDGENQHKKRSYENPYGISFSKCKINRAVVSLFDPR